jgi:hypothetical protein
MWEELYRRLKIIDTRGYRPVPKPTTDTLDRFETQTGLPLPRSYRHFAAVFGPGELAEFARLCAPGYPGDDTLDLYDRNRFTHGGEDILTDLYGEPERVGRAAGGGRPGYPVFGIRRVPLRHRHGFDLRAG